MSRIRRTAACTHVDQRMSGKDEGRNEVCRMVKMALRLQRDRLRSLLRFHTAVSICVTLHIISVSASIIEWQ